MIGDDDVSFCVPRLLRLCCYNNIRNRSLMVFCDRKIDTEEGRTAFT